MKIKTARRFLNRNKWNIAKAKIEEWPSRSLKRRVKFCRKILLKGETG